MGSIFAITCPAFTLSPTATSTAVRVPPVSKLTVSVSAGLMFPEADTLDETVPTWTVTVLATELDADAEWKIDRRPSVSTTAAPAVNTT